MKLLALVAGLSAGAFTITSMVNTRNKKAKKELEKVATELFSPVFKAYGMHESPFLEEVMGKWIVRQSLKSHLHTPGSYGRLTTNASLRMLLKRQAQNVALFTYALKMNPAPIASAIMKENSAQKFPGLLINSETDEFFMAHLNNFMILERNKGKPSRARIEAAFHMINSD